MAPSLKNMGTQGWGYSDKTILVNSWGITQAQNQQAIFPGSLGSSLIVVGRAQSPDGLIKGGVTSTLWQLGRVTAVVASQLGIGPTSAVPGNWNLNVRGLWGGSDSYKALDESTVKVSQTGKLSYLTIRTTLLVALNTSDLIRHWSYTSDRDVLIMWRWAIPPCISRRSSPRHIWQGDRKQHACELSFAPVSGLRPLYCLHTSRHNLNPVWLRASAIRRFEIGCWSRWSSSGTQTVQKERLLRFLLRRSSLCTESMRLRTLKPNNDEVCGNRESLRNEDSFVRSARWPVTTGLGNHVKRREKNWLKGI